MRQPLIEQRKADFDRAIDHFHNELATVRTGRASAALVENVQVESYGTNSPLKNLAGITVQDARTLLIQPWDRSVLASIEKAIQAANLGFTPINDGLHIRISIPSPTEERRKELAKTVRQMAEAARVRIRNIREEIWREVGKMVKDKKLTEDDKYQAEEELKKLVNEFNESIKQILEKKEAEVMTV